MVAMHKPARALLGQSLIWALLYTRALAAVLWRRALYELAISQPALDMPEALWKVSPAGGGGCGGQLLAG